MKFLIVFYVLFLVVCFYGYRHSVTPVWCKTGGAHMKDKTTDGNLHVTLWCVKDGRVVQ